MSVGRAAGIRLRLLLALGAGQLFATDVHGQEIDDPPPAWVRVDLQATSRRLWHGLTRVSGLAATSEALAGIRTPVGSFAVGAVVTWDLCQCAGNVRLLGDGRHGPGELDVWAEYRLGTGALGFSAGWARYMFYGDASRGGIGFASNSYELYFTAEVQQIYLSPRLSAWIDLGPVQGTYLELGGSLPILGWPYSPFHEVYLDGEIGYSVSQGPNADDPGQLARYRGDGFTHARLKLGFDLLRRPHMTIPVGVELQANFDEATKRARPGPPRDLAFGVSAGVLWYHPFGAPRR